MKRREFVKLSGAAAAKPAARVPPTSRRRRATRQFQESTDVSHVPYWVVLPGKFITHPWRKS